MSESSAEAKHTYADAATGSLTAAGTNAAPRAPPPAAEDGDPNPPWGDDEFDPEKAWKTIQNLRARQGEFEKVAMTEEQQKQLDEYNALVEASKTEAQRREEAEQRAAATRRRLRTKPTSSGRAEARHHRRRLRPTGHRLDRGDRRPRAEDRSQESSSQAGCARGCSAAGNTRTTSPHRAVEARSLAIA
jgi:hypothetical protein